MSGWPQLPLTSAGSPGWRVGGPRLKRIIANQTGQSANGAGRIYAPRMRDIETIDRELRLLARAWRVARELCTHPPSIAHIDELLDERSATWC